MMAIYLAIYVPVGENTIVNPWTTHSYPGNIYELRRNKRFTPYDVANIANYPDNTGDNQMTYIGDIGDIASALNEVEKQVKRNLTHLFTSPPTRQLPAVKEISQPEMQKGYATSLDNLELQKQMKNIDVINEKEKLKNKLVSTLNNPVIESRFNKMFDDNSKETKYYTPSVRPREQQSWQERIKKDQEMEKLEKLKRLKNKVSKLRKEANKEYYGYGIVPPIYPAKMLVNLIKLLARIYEGYALKEVVNETKRLLNTLCNNKIIAETVYNHLANI